DDQHALGLADLAIGVAQWALHLVIEDGYLRYPPERSPSSQGCPCRLKSLVFVATIVRED
ncbi:MAG TPA: hypothetical protein VGG86_10750, partial [Roseiarcus sp.]